VSSTASGTTVGTPPELRGQSLYLALEPSPVFAVLHLPPRAEPKATGVVLCAPFGWDELSTHRSMRAWAGMLAQAGYPTLRFDLPATGDSAGSPRDPELLERWTDATAGVAEWLRQDRGCQRIVAIGIGLGGMLACRAIAAGSAIDDAVLWAVPAHGRLLVREMRTFARMVPPDVDDAEDTDEEPEVLLDDGSLNAAGFLLSADTIAALEALDLCALPIADAAHRRILMLGRDTLSPDPKLRAHLETSGVAVSVIDGLGYAGMVSHPQLSTVPRETFERTIAWLDDQPPSSAGRRSDAGSATRVTPSRQSIELLCDGTVVLERPFALDYEGSTLNGILAEPSSPPGRGMPCAVLLNAGAVRRIGPHRMWVEIARRWAALGVPTLRLDVARLGDSDDIPSSDTLDDYILSEAVRSQVLAALDALEALGHTDGFVLAGLCSGAHWSLHAALADPRVRGLCLVNIRQWIWSNELGAMRDARRARRLLRKRELGQIVHVALTSRSRIPRLVQAKLRAVLHGSLGGGAAAELGRQVAGSLDLLRDRNVPMLLLLSYGEPVFEDFVEFGLIDRLAEWPNLRLERIDFYDHVVRPFWAQKRVHAAVDATLARALAQDVARLPGAR